MTLDRRRGVCGATTVFWPDAEACDAACFLLPGHDDPTRHADRTLGEWSEDELPTTSGEDHGGHR